MDPENNPARILFVCTANSCRSQMAEGWARHLHGDALHARSAGVQPGNLDPNAVEVMAEVGIDIAGQLPKSVASLPAERYDLVVTVCDRARAICPVIPGARRVVHAAFPDPPALAARAGSSEEALAAYREVRDEIRRFVAALPERLAPDSPP